MTLMLRISSTRLQCCFCVIDLLSSSHDFTAASCDICHLDVASLFFSGHSRVASSCDFGEYSCFFCSVALAVRAVCLLFLCVVSLFSSLLYRMILAHLPRSGSE